MFDQFERLDMTGPPMRQGLRPLIWLYVFPHMLRHRFKLNRINTDGLEPPYLMLCSHNAFDDFRAAAWAAFPKRSNYVSAINAYLAGWPEDAGTPAPGRSLPDLCQQLLRREDPALLKAHTLFVDAFLDWVQEYVACNDYRRLRLPDKEKQQEAPEKRLRFGGIGVFLPVYMRFEY